MSDHAVRACDMVRVEAYTNYDLAVVTPVIFPLSFALVAQSYSWFVLLRERHDGPLSVRILAVAELFVETCFGVFCWLSCVMNYAERKYVGGERACEWQGWYAAWYTWSQLPIIIMLALATRAVASNGAADLPKPCIVGAACVSVFCVAAVISALPLFGAGHYVFPKDYCMYDLQSPMFGGLFLPAFLGALVAITIGPLKVAVCSDAWATDALRKVSGAASGFFAWGWAPALVITCYGLAHGNSCSDAFANDGPWYGLNAIFLHVQQLANPVLYAVFWRREVAYVCERAAHASNENDIDQQNETDPAKHGSSP